jgi:hypothetical protein
MPMPRLVAGAAVILLGPLALTACGGDGGNSQGTDPSKVPTKVIAISIKGGDTDPSGEHLDVSVGQPIELDVTADQPGEIHVHSDPEQEFEYHSGSSTLELNPIQVPGQVDVESHTLSRLLFTLVAR